MLDYTAKMREVIEDICRRHGAFRHIDVSRVFVCSSQTRRRGPHGTHAALMPLRFEGGAMEMTRDGERWRMPELIVDGVEMLYALQLYLPRFCNRTAEEKLTTLCHELYHISPEFDGYLRRHPGRAWQHGRSRKQYDELMRGMVAKYLASDPPQELLDFLKLDFDGLSREHGAIYGARMRRPRPFCVAEGAEPEPE
jgi:predicted metallopeptidase